MITPNMRARSFDLSTAGPIAIFAFTLAVFLMVLLSGCDKRINEVRGGAPAEKQTLTANAVTPAKATTPIKSDSDCCEEPVGSLGELGVVSAAK